MKTPRTTLLTVTLLALLAPLRLSAQAQNERPSDEEGPYQRPAAAAEAINRLKSPYCPGQMLGTCPSPAGAALRDSLGQLAEEGMTAEEIVDWVVANHGERYRALPETSGIDLVAWIVPPAGGLLGLVVLLIALRRIRRRRSEQGEGAVDEISEVEEARLQEALKALELEEEAPFL